MGVMLLDTLVYAIDMATRFDEDITHSQEVCRKKGLMVPSMKFKVLFVFKGP